MLVKLVCMLVTLLSARVKEVEALDFDLSTDANTSSNVTELTPFETLQVQAVSIPSRAKFLLFAVHHQQDLLTLSLIEKRSPRPKGTFVTGRDVGLVVFMEKTNATTASVWLTSNNHQRSRVLITISWYLSSDPVPGGCNLEFDVETSPFVKLQESRIENRLDFQLASILSQRDIHPPTCDTSLSLIRYEVFAYFLLENDYSEDELFRGVRLMSDPKTIVKYGSKVDTYSTSRRTRVQLLSYPGRGVVYAVLAFFDQQSSAYVPVSSYNCDLRSSIAGCGKMNDIFAVVMLCILSVTGLVVTLRGHQWFEYQVCWSGYLCSFIFLLIILAQNTSLGSSEREITALVASFGVAIIWLGVWRCFKTPMISVTASGILLGFLVISTVLFTTLGNEELFRSDLNYWIILGAGSFVIPVVLMPFGILLSIFSSSIVGSYAVIFAADRFIGGSLSFIVINVLKRAAYKDVLNASNQVPFQKKDIAVTIAWGGLALAGLVTQLYMSTSQTRQETRSNSVRLRRTSRRRSSSSRSRSRLRRSSRSRSIRPTAPPTEHAEENRPLIVEAAPIIYSAI